MSTLKETLNDNLHMAMKNRDEVTVRTLRMVLTAVTVAETAGKQVKELSDADVIKVIASEAKKRKDSIEAYTLAKRDDLVKQEQDELNILATYLPQALTEDQVDTLVREKVAAVGATSMRDMGKVMKELSAETAGRVDGKMLADKVKKALAS